MSSRRLIQKLSKPIGANSLALLLLFSSSSACESSDDKSDTNPSETSSGGEGEGESGAESDQGNENAESQTSSNPTAGDMGETGEGDTAGTMDESGGAMPQENGSECDVDEECISGRCFLFGGLLGVCGECRDEKDCDNGGCSPPDPLEVPPTPSMCNNGALGDACETDEVCQEDRICLVSINIPNTITIRGCSDCGNDDACSDGQLCTPQMDVANFRGYSICEAPGSAELNEGCDLNGSGDQQCASGICTEASVLGSDPVGICGSCREDGDCSEGEQCVPAEIGLDGTIEGSHCAVPEE